MGLEQQITALVAASNALTGEVSGKMAVINQTVSAQKAELEAWRLGARDEMALPFRATVIVGGDANTFYPVPIRNYSHEKLGRLVIYRHASALHPKELGADNVAALLLELRVRADRWSDFSHTRVDYYGFSYHQSVAKVREDAVGRIVWLRGGGMEYKFLSDFDLSSGVVYCGTEILKPILGTGVPVYPEYPAPPYSGAGVKVSPLGAAPYAAPDAMWASHITTPTTI